MRKPHICPMITAAAPRWPATLAGAESVTRELQVQVLELRLGAEGREGAVGQGAAVEAPVGLLIFSSESKNASHQRNVSHKNALRNALQHRREFIAEKCAVKAA